MQHHLFVKTVSDETTWSTGFETGAVKLLKNVYHLKIVGCETVCVNCSVEYHIDAQQLVPNITRQDWDTRMSDNSKNERLPHWLMNCHWGSNFANLAGHGEHIGIVNREGCQLVLSMFISGIERTVLKHGTPFVLSWKRLLVCLLRCVCGRARKERARVLNLTPDRHP